MEKISLQEFTELAYRAFYWTSISPDRVGKRTIDDYEIQLNEDLQSIPEAEKQRYVETYKKLFSAWLRTHANCASSAVTGGSGFNVQRAEKANNRERARMAEFTEWREKALKGIAKRVENSKPQELKDAEQFNELKKQVDRLFEGWGCLNFKGRLETVARGGNTDLVSKVLEYIKLMQVEKNRVLFTPRNSIWSLANRAEVIRETAIDKESAESKEYEINGVKVVENIQADRIQLFFDGKPSLDIISILKHTAFKWSPTNKCWQRKLTDNAIEVAKRILTDDAV